jgi:hypothetical protein
MTFFSSGTLPGHEYRASKVRARRVKPVNGLL